MMQSLPPCVSGPGVPDLQVGHPPAAMPHLTGHDPQAFGLHLTSARPGERTLQPKLKAWENQPIAMNIRLNEQHGTANRIERDQVTLITQGLHADLAVTTPGVPIERLTTIVEDTVWLHDAFAGGQQSLDDVWWVFNDVDIEPQDPILVVQRVEQQMVPAACQDAPPPHLQVLSPTRRPGTDAVPEILLPEPHVPEPSLQLWESPL